MKKSRKKQVGKKKTPKKRSKAKSDAIKAFQLVCILIAVSICISLAVISIYKNRNTPGENDVTEQPETKMDPVITVQPEPEINITAPPLKPALDIPSAEVTAGKKSEIKDTPAVAVIPASKTETKKSGSVAFVIDDAGNNLHELEPFLKIPGPVTIAVLPGLPYSAEAARRIRNAGKEVILHQPMEAVGGQHPGPGAIYSYMTEDEIRDVLRKNLDEVGPVSGMNNHQGSLITMKNDMMEIILAFCAENGIYFLDSRTTAETAVPSAARRLGIKIAERDAFLDNEQDKESMMRYLNIGLDRAQRNGKTVMIGHTHSPALATLLAEQFPILMIQGYTIKTVSEMLR